MPAQKPPMHTEIQDWRRLLSAAERAQMLAGIARVALVVGAELFPEQPWASFGVRPDPDAPAKSPLEQLGWIEDRLPSLSAAFAQVERSPLTAARGSARAALPVQARRVSPAAWMAHARRSPARRTVDETVTTVSHDTPEHRAVKSFAETLQRDCGAIERLAEAEEAFEAAGRAAQCVRRLHRLCGADWWERVPAGRGDWTRPPAAREIARPEYARLAAARNDYRRGFGFEWDTPLLTLPPRETWRIYELWCLFSALDALRSLGWRTLSGGSLLAVQAGRLALTLEAGAASEIVLWSPPGRKLTLTYRRTFAEGRDSLSHAMQPDLTLSDGARIWILDAKFKPYTEPGEEGADINQMHAYRDAIVGAGSGGRRIVSAAWCLYAGLTDFPNRAEIAYGQGPEAAVGALCLRPGDGATQMALRGLLARWTGQGEAAAGRQAFPKT